VPAIPLNAEQETGHVASHGSGFFSYSINGNQLCYTLEVRDLTAAPVAAHIHPGPRNIAGPVPFRCSRRPQQRALSPIASRRPQTGR
jgi:hypothetical protein